jgi:signal transduction histidine kinase
VKVSARLSRTGLELRFDDNGLGIDLEKHGSKLFGMYKTFHHHEDSRGLGLHISKNQVEALGGRIEVESTVGLGSCFYVFLPVEGSTAPQV